MKPRSTHQMKRSIPSILRIAAPLVGLLGSIQAASAAITIGFETSEGYAAAPADFVNAVDNNAATAHPLTGNSEGWSTSTSTDAGRLITTSNSGDYVGGQALSTTVTGSGASYIGAIDLGLSSGFTTFTFDVGSQATASGYSAYVAGFSDVNTDSAFTQNTEAGPGAGIINGTFGIRLANLGSTFSTGVGTTIGDFYRLTVGLVFATNTITLDALNLTAGSTVVDLNGASAGNTFSVTNAGMFGGVNPSDYEGVVARASGFGVVDNITVIPEPSAALLGGLGMLGLLRRRRSQG